MSAEFQRALARWSTHAVEYSPDGVLVVSADGTIVYDNAAMRQLAGADGPLAGRALDELVPDDVRGHHGQLRDSYFESPTQRPMGSGLDLALRRRCV